MGRFGAWEEEDGGGVGEIGRIFLNIAIFPKDSENNG